MPAYWIAHVEVTDEETYGKYAPLAKQAIEAHGGRFLARGGRYHQLEGNDRARNVVAEFPTLEDALACYNSETCVRARAYADVSAKRDLVIVEGV